MANPTKLVINCSTGVQEHIELTDEEVADMEQRAAIYAIEKAEAEAQAQAQADLKASAKAKLVAGTPLTEEEAATIVL
jgi:hypothetical protein